MKQQSHTAAASARQPYAGIGVGASFLNADTSDLPFDQDKSIGTAAQLTLGFSLDNDHSLELRAADLGEATFTNGGATGYQVSDVSALYKRHLAKFSGFARLGVGALFKGGDVDEKNVVKLLVGFGAQYSFNSKYALRAEWQGHDADIVHSQISVLYRFGANANQTGPRIIAKNDSKTTNTQKLSDTDFQAVPNKALDPESIAIGGERAPGVVPSEPEPTEPRVTEPDTVLETQATDSVPESAVAIPQMKIVQKVDANAEQAKPPSEDNNEALLPPTSDEQVAPPNKPGVSEPQERTNSMLVQTENVAAPVDADKDGANDALENCLGANARLSALAQGCTMFEDLVPRLTFVPDTDQLSTSGEEVLDAVADGLAKEPDVQVTVAVHTAPTTDANEAIYLTRRRTIAIIRYLSDKGVDATRLRPEAYGDTQPLADAKSPTDNERVVFSKL